MFEGTLVESRGLAGTGTARWTALGSITVQCAIAGLLIAIPLLHPEGLPMLSDAPKMTVPLPTRPPVVVPVQATTSAAASAASMPVENVAATASRRFQFPRPGDAPEGPLPVGIANLRMGIGESALPMGLPTVALMPSVAVVPAKRSGPVRISSGVSTGMLLSEIRPVYPAIAKAAGVQGAVVMEAVISKAGRIESLRAVSGPAMLRGAALDAVQAARYEPYRLNGEATEVQTTITVNFRLGN